MNFSSPQKVTDTIRASDQVEQIRGENRVKVNNLFNGVPPLTVEQAKRTNVKINVNWGEAVVLAAHARRQYENALLNKQNYFKVKLPKAPPEKRLDWELEITSNINRIMKQSEEYASEKESQFAAVVAHGIGPMLWCDAHSWAPEFVAIEDFRVATDTKTSLKNLGWLAVRKPYTEGELARKVFGKNADPGWNKKGISEILKMYHNDNFERGGAPYDWITQPEKMAELVKQNSGFYSSDAVPTIPLWHFYYVDDNLRNPQIMLCVVPDLGVKGARGDDFLYKKDKPVCSGWKRLINVQFGDLNNTAPFRYHSVRSLGFLLMEPCFWTNMFRCRFLQHVLENFNTWLRIADPDGRARAQKIEMFDRGILPEGVSVVPKAERHEIDPALVNNAMAQLKQLQSEASQSYTQQADTGTSKEQTAFETRVKLESVNAMMTGLLGRAFRKETFEYREISRRFCLRNSPDPDVREFQKACKDAGVPPLFLNVELWDIQPEIPIGAGNPTMAQAQAGQLMEVRPLLDPTGQIEVLHDYVAAVTSDPRKAERLVPLDKGRGVTDAQRDAELSFGTLMQGVPVQIKEGFSPIEQIETLLGLMAGVVSRITQTGGMATMQEVVGLHTVGQHIAQLIQTLAQDERQKSRVKEYGDDLGQLMNEVKAFAQRLEEQMQSQNGDPQAMAQAQAAMLKAQTDAQIKQAQSGQKMALKQQQTEQQLALKQQSFESDQALKTAQVTSDIARQNLKVKADVAALEQRTEATVEAAKRKEETALQE